MNDLFRELINMRFPHIEFSSEDEMKEWFCNNFLPLLVLRWMGGVKTLDNGMGEFDPRVLDGVRRQIIDWYKVVA